MCWNIHGVNGDGAWILYCWVRWWNDGRTTFGHEIGSGSGARWRRKPWTKFSRAWLVKMLRRSENTLWWERFRIWSKVKKGDWDKFVIVCVRDRAQDSSPDLDKEICHHQWAWKVLGMWMWISEICDHVIKYLRAVHENYIHGSSKVWDTHTSLGWRPKSSSFGS